MTTIAQKIADQFGPGDVWYDSDGANLSEVAGQSGINFETRTDDHMVWERVEFADGSALLVGPDFWDVETGGRWTFSCGTVFEGRLIDERAA